MTRTLAELLAEAAAKIERVAPAEAAASGALIVDIRSQDSRERDGVVPGALHVPRTVLEWRADPRGDWRSAELVAAPRVLLLCDHGYSSILAAATLVDLGYRAGDVVGGFEAWRAAGLPVRAAGPAPDGLPGFGPRD
jgi:rhodanese-related sulfurtransferase